VLLASPHAGGLLVEESRLTERIVERCLRTAAWITPLDAIAAATSLTRALRGATALVSQRIRARANRPVAHVLFGEREDRRTDPVGDLRRDSPLGLAVARAEDYQRRGQRDSGGADDLLVGQRLADESRRRACGLEEDALTSGDCSLERGVTPWGDQDRDGAAVGGSQSSGEHHRAP